MFSNIIQTDRSLINQSINQSIKFNQSKFSYKGPEPTWKKLTYLVECRLGGCPPFVLGL